MGAWGVAPFDDDLALDWIEGLRSARTWAKVRRKLSVPDHGEFDVLPSVEVAAVAVVAVARGMDLLDVPDEVTEFVGRVDPPSADLVDAAVAFADALLMQADLSDLWATEEDAAMWRLGVERMRLGVLDATKLSVIERPPLPSLRWSSPLVREAVVRVAAAEGWMELGELSSEAYWMKRPEPSAAWLLGLIVVEMVAASFGRPTTDMPRGLRLAVEEFGLPDVWQASVASSISRVQLNARRTREGPLESDDPDVNRHARLVGVSADRVLASGSEELRLGWDSLWARLPPPTRFARLAHRAPLSRKRRLVRMRLVSTELLGIVAPVAGQSGPRGWSWVVVLHPGVASSRPWDERILAGPFAVWNADLQHGHLVPASPGAGDDGGPVPWGAEVQAADTRAWPGLPERRVGWNDPLALCELDLEVSRALGMPADGSFRAVTERAAMMGQSEILPGAPISTWHLWQRYFSRRDREETMSALAAVLPTPEETQALRRAFYTTTPAFAGGAVVASRPLSHDVGPMDEGG